MVFLPQFQVLKYLRRRVNSWSADRMNKLFGSIIKKSSSKLARETRQVLISIEMDQCNDY